MFEVERGMSYYRMALFEYFPFVIMPDVRYSAAEFGKSKPFLALVIAMLGCTADRARQRELLVHAKSFVALHVIEKGEKSLDLLQGLLVLIHWCVISACCPHTKPLTVVQVPLAARNEETAQHLHAYVHESDSRPRFK